MIEELRREEDEEYIKERRRRGLKDVMVNIMEKKFERNENENEYGERNLKERELGEINNKYLDNEEWVIGREEDIGIKVFMDKEYMGENGGGKGWYMEMEMEGKKRMREYGEVIERRFDGYRNIIWVLGGDFDEKEKRIV